MSAPTKRDISNILTQSDIQRFIDAKFREDSECPRCHAVSWDVVEEVEQRNITGLIVMDERKQLIGASPVIQIVCQNCGFISLHAKNIVAEWLNDNE